MDVLVRRYYERLAEKIRQLPECRIVFGWVDKSLKLDSESLIADLASNDESSFYIWINTEKKDTGIKDFRLRKFMLAHFRKFNDYEGNSYLINLMDKVKGMSSLFLVGKNGSGKTSIFTALEYLLTPQHCSTLEQRNLSDDDKYFPYGNRTKGDITLEAELIDGNRITEPIECDLSLNPFFCSDVDLQKLQQEHDLESIFTKEIGIGKIDELLTILKDTISELSQPNSTTSTNFLFEGATDSLPADMFYLGGILYDSAFIKIMKALRTLIEGEPLRQFFSGSHVLTVADKEELLTKINALCKIWKSVQNMRSLKIYQTDDAIIKRYANVANLLKEDNDFEAEELYQKLIPIETLSKELSEYVLFLYRKFQDKRLERNAEQRREVALAAILDFERQRSEYERKQLLSMNAEQLRNYPDRINNLSKVCEALKQVYDEDKKRLLSACRSLIVHLLNEFTRLDKSNDKEEKLDIIENQGKLVAIVRNEAVFGKNNETTPAKYYNSFRYKLYCISIKIVLAFMTMKISKVKAPLVFDDVFTASDFDNTVNINKFFEVLFRVFEEFGLGKKKELQIVLFTHDEVVLNSLSDIIEAIDEGSKEPCGISYISGILTDPKAIDERDLVEISETKKVYSLYSRIN